MNSEYPINREEAGAAEVMNPTTGWLLVQTVERSHRRLGGDARVEGMILRFIAG